jgi:CDP-diacylglycerol--serine O-phosphatidyltransferase
MKHLPNLLTLANLFCGCIAIVYILSAQPYTSMNMDSGMPAWQWVHGAEQIYSGSIFIGIAALCDMLDGLVARALKVFSPIGKDLDSLADVVSFGVAPSAIIFKLLWDSLMAEQNAFDVSMFAMAPAFLIACFAALRLAKFNITADMQRAYFIGMPTPAAGLFVASFPLVMWYNPYSAARYFMSSEYKGYAPAWVVSLCDMAAQTQHLLRKCFQSKWSLYLIIALLCWLMASGTRFIKLTAAANGGKKGVARFWPQIVLIVLTLVAIPIIQMAAIPFAFILYVLLSLVYRQPDSRLVDSR